MHLDDDGNIFFDGTMEDNLIQYFGQWWFSPRTIVILPCLVTSYNEFETVSGDEIKNQNVKIQHRWLYKRAKSFGKFMDI